MRAAALLLVVALGGSVARAEDSGAEGGARPPPVEPMGDDQVVQFVRPISVTTATGAQLRLPPGYYVPDPVWTRMAVEFQRLETAATTPQPVVISLVPAWWVLTLCAAGGFGLGYWIAVR